MRRTQVSYTSHFFLTACLYLDQLSHCAVRLDSLSGLRLFSARPFSKSSGDWLVAASYLNTDPPGISDRLTAFTF